MNIRTGVGLAGVVAGVVSVGMLAIAVPTLLWTNDGIVAAIVLFLSFASPVFLFAPMLRDNATDAPFIWLIGPFGQFWALLLLVAVSALRVSLIGWHKATWITCLGWLGLYLAGFVILRASTQIVAVASNQTRVSSTDARAKWTRSLQVLQVQAADDDVRRSIECITEKVQFAANESNCQEPRENQEIDAILGQLAENLDKSDEIAKLIRSAELLLAQREHYLRAARTRA